MNWSDFRPPIFVPIYAMFMPWTDKVIRQATYPTPTPTIGLGVLIFTTNVALSSMVFQCLRPDATFLIRPDCSQSNLVWQ